MMDIFKQHITIDKFFNDGRGFKPVNKSDYISYREFLKYFSDLPKIEKHNLIIGINFSYGWMPTCFDFHSENFDPAVEILNRTKQGMTPTIDELKLLKDLFNNSLVGTLKLLHFISPSTMAIWDSRVYRYLTGQEYYEDRKGICGAFLDYLKFCDFLTQQSGYNQIHSSIEEQVDYPMSRFRTAELIMYNNGAKPV